jgi:trehalose 6-phosphate synthase
MVATTPCLLSSPVGWPGIEIPMEDRALVNQRLMDEFQCQAVYLSDDVADKHYKSVLPAHLLLQSARPLTSHVAPPSPRSGFSNSILWPLFHYHPGEMNFDESHWLAYRAVNLTFAQVVLSQVQKGDMVWVQDYHLMLLPMLLRGLIAGQAAGPEGTLGGDGVGSETQKELGRVVEGIETGAGEDQGEKPKSDRKADVGPLGVNDIKIGFFLHTPFPSSEIYRSVPPASWVIRAFIRADLLCCLL